MATDMKAIFGIFDPAVVAIVFDKRFSVSVSPIDGDVMKSGGDLTAKHPFCNGMRRWCRHAANDDQK